MATWSSSLITDAGLELLEQAVSGGGVTITRAGLGGGTVSTSALAAQTALTAPLTTVPCLIASQKQLEGSSGLEIKLQIRNDSLTESKTFKQVGLFAKVGDGEEVLFAIAQDENGEEVPAETEYPDFLEEFTFVAAFTNTGNVTVNVSPLVFVTRGEMETELAKVMNIAACNSGLLDNPDFSINQRGVSGEISTAGYFVDRWKLKSGTVTLNSDGSITLDGTIEQILETAVGTDVTASASAGTASYDNTTKTFTLTASGKKITWAKLEKGSVATAFCPPNAAMELARCQRYLQKMSALETLRAAYVLPNYIDFSVPTPVTMRPGSITVSGSADVYPFPIATAVSGFTFSVVGFAQNQLRFRATKTAHGLTDAVLSVPSGGSILLSSEL